MIYTDLKSKHDQVYMTTKQYLLLSYELEKDVID
jgi:hypothetical protein